MNYHIVIEGPCGHGETKRHRAPDPNSYLATYLCNGVGSRRVLTEGEFIDLVAAVLHDHGAVKAASGNWVDTPSASGCPRAEAHFGSAQRILDALAGGKEEPPYGVDWPLIDRVFRGGAQS